MSRNNAKDSARYISPIYTYNQEDDEGIYLLAKDLAYNVALDQTSQLTEGIKQLTKKNMRDVSQAINILDPSKGGSTAIDKKICKTGTNDWTNSNNEGTSAGEKCATKASLAGGNGTDVGLGILMRDDNQPGSGKFTDDMKLSEIPKTSAKISKDIRGLTREEHGVVSSAFAKAHEGAEIVEIRSIQPEIPEKATLTTTHSFPKMLSCLTKTYILPQLHHLNMLYSCLRCQTLV